MIVSTKRTYTYCCNAQIVCHSENQASFSAYILCSIWSELLIAFDAGQSLVMRHLLWKRLLGSIRLGNIGARWNGTHRALNWDVDVRCHSALCDMGFHTQVFLAFHFDSIFKLLAWLIFELTHIYLLSLTPFCTTEKLEQRHVMHTCGIIYK